MKSLKLRRTLSKSGRGLVLRIPRDIERFLQLQPGQAVEIWIEEGKIVVSTAERDAKRRE